LLAPTTNALVDVLQKRKNVADPLAEAGVLVSMLAHVAAHEQGLQSWGASPNELRRSMARILYVTLTGQLSPS
jgi:predicted metal-binding protein